MNKEELTPSESISIITKVIVEAKSRFRDNGFSFIFIGICISVASFCQFMLIKAEYYQINFYPYFIMPVAGVITFLYYRRRFKKQRKGKNALSSMLSALGIVIGLNAMMIGFVFSDRFLDVLFPVMFIFLGLWGIMSGITMRYRIVLYSGIAVNIIAYLSFYFDPVYHPLLLALVSLIGLVIPGIVFSQLQKVDDV